jgi:hypothetical protein
MVLRFVILVVACIDPSWHLLLKLHHLFEPFGDEIATQVAEE